MTMKHNDPAWARRYAFLALLFLALFLLCRLFPNTGDDWYREGLGAAIRSPAQLLGEVARRWRTTNARILGNALAYAAGSRRLARDLLRGGFLFALVLLAAKNAGFRSRRGTLLTAAALLALPREMFRQIYPWAAGFFNYVPPVVLLLGFFALADGVFTGEEIPDGALRRAAAFLCGFCAQLFVENDTLCALCAGAALCVWRRVRRAKRSGVLLLFLLGAALGAALLFSSPAYRGLSETGGAYTSALAGGLAGMLASARGNWKEILRWLIAKCPALFVPMTALAGAAFGRAKPKRAADTALLAVLLLTCLAMLAGVFSARFDAAACLAGLAWGAAFLLACARWMSGAALRGKALFFICAAAVAAAPLLVVNPIGPRCLFLSYVFLLLAALCLLRDLGAERLDARLAGAVSAALAAAVLVFFLRIFVPIHSADTLRLRAVGDAMARREPGVTLAPLPHGGWLWEPETPKMMRAFYYETPGDFAIGFEAEARP